MPDDGGSAHDAHRHGIFALSDEYIVERAAIDPVLGTVWGVPGHDHELSGYSPEFWARRLELERRTIAALDRLPPGSRSDEVAADVLRERAQVEIDMITSDEYAITLNTLSSAHVYARDIFDLMPRETPAHWSTIRDRLAHVPATLDGIRRGYVEAAGRGNVAARRMALASADQCDSVAGPDGPFRSMAAAAESVDLGDVADAAGAAFGEFGIWLRDEYAPIATDDTAVGRDRYRLNARLHNGVDLDLDEAYEWGWDELDRIVTRMDELATALHPDETRLGCIERIKRDERYVIEGVDAFMTWTQDTIDTTIRSLDGDAFDIPEPLWTCTAMQIPSDVVDNAYYIPPTEDFSRPGTVWQPTAGRDSFPLWETLSTLYHESVPGHHLQLGHMMYLSDSLTRFQRLAVFIAGHGEGWALYAERLMHELGYLDDPVYEIGWLSGQALRAARVVVDIGMHCRMTIPTGQPFHPGQVWTPDLAVDFLVEATGQDRTVMQSEVDRYLGMPGQAISYKLGERVFVEARAAVERRLGDRFDLKEFHRQVLDLGAMGLDQLRNELAQIEM